ncbi:TRAP transporter large permease [Antarcticimicrobium luteum]|uniref:TRAP transporter large permease protein n=1 Tax=Antarcticimicrobium luteum TaxID=2547397 RepID=A0A4R5UX30_9RHOB|nr:TRAP transporter large permease [Antarcticimicrobium luteum]TDK43842.1 TRAP transporter large permease [Antarcticimicrobium luteum]
MLTFSLLALVAFALLSGALLGVLIGAAGLTVLWFEFNGNFSVLGNASWNLFNSFTFTAVPAFILLGEILGQSGLAKRIYGAISPGFERLPGKLLQTNIGACTVFSAISGSSTATAAVVGSIAYDELKDRGYDRSAIVGTIAAGGTLGILIPPSIALIVYGAWQNVSVGALFLAGVVPGLLLTGLFMVYIAVLAKLRPKAVPPAREVMPLARALAKSAEAWPFLILVFAILGTIFLGLATPTEAAALGVVTAIVLAALYREFSLARLWAALMATARTFSTLALVILGALILSQAVALTGLPRVLIELVGEAGLPAPAVITLIYLLYLVLGCFFGPLEMLLITLPFVFPLVTGLGYDPVWFGIVLVIVIEIGLLTPPLGINLFVVMAVSRNEISLGQAALACLPYWLLMLAALALITIVPQIALMLPQAAGFG